MGGMRTGYVITRTEINRLITDVQRWNSVLANDNKATPISEMEGRVAGGIAGLVAIRLDVPDEQHVKPLMMLGVGKVPPNLFRS